MLGPEGNKICSVMALWVEVYEALEMFNEDYRSWLVLCCSVEH